MKRQSAERLRNDLCAGLRGEPVGVSVDLVEMARHHRVHLLLAESVSGEGPNQPASEALAAAVRTAAIIDALRERVLRQLLYVFDAAHIDVLLMKGAGLAYTVYRSSYLRPRVDVDVLVARQRLDDADRLLQSEGWARDREPESTVAASQWHYRRRASDRLTEQLDLHWKVANPRTFGDALTFEELWMRSVSIPALGAGARTLSRVDALLVACMHRVAHHQDEIELLWLWDIHLLASGLSDGEAGEFVDVARRTGMRAVCGRGVALSLKLFATPKAAALVAALTKDSIEIEPSARFVGGRLRMVDLLGADLAATPEWRARLALLREHLFPSIAYMRSAYDSWPVALLPFAYGHRILRGAPKWLRRPAGGSAD